jgi:hypothetical protein
VSILRCFPFFVVLLSTGCSYDPDELDLPQSKEKPASLIGQSFNPERTGRITGQVSWGDRLPNVSPIEYRLPKPNGAGFESHITTNPNRPKINASTRAIGEAVVFLRNIDVAGSHPWDLPPVSVAIGEGQIVVKQGNRQGRNGFVRCGDSIKMVSTEAIFHIIRGRNDGFFSITFPKPEDPVTRTLNNEGRIELSSGAGLSWMRADLFVSDHPYYTHTDLTGQFAFEQVPLGRCELVVWLPNWEAGKPIYEPESAIIARQTYAPAYEKVVPITVGSGEVATIKVLLP